MRYYNVNKILKKDSVYNMIFGERSNGKTYALLKLAIDNKIKHNAEFVYLRRWRDDVKGSRMKQLFKSLIDNGEIEKITKGKYTSVVFKTGMFYLCNYSEDNEPLFNDDDKLGYSFALSENEHNKSVSYPKVTTIVFDEFITNHLYLQDEFVTFMNTVSTIVRSRTNVKIFMLGNTVNKYCIYFKEMGLNHITDMKQGSIDVYNYGDSKLTVAVEYTASNKLLKPNNYYFAFNNPKLKMITGGSWQLGIYPHLPMKYKPKDIAFTYFIIFNDITYQCEIIFLKNITFTYIHLKTTPIQNPNSDIIYSLDMNPKANYNVNILKPRYEFEKKIAWYYNNLKVFYQDNSVGNSIANYIKICKRS